MERPEQAWSMLASIAVPEGVLIVLPARRPGEAVGEWLKRCIMVRGIGECAGLAPVDAESLRRTGGR